jgi:hypothetical protein
VYFSLVLVRVVVYYYPDPYTLALFYRRGISIYSSRVRKYKVLDLLIIGFSSFRFR